MLTKQEWTINLVNISLIINTILWSPINIYILFNDTFSDRVRITFNNLFKDVIYQYNKYLTRRTRVWFKRRCILKYYERGSVLAKKHQIAPPPPHNH